MKPRIAALQRMPNLFAPFAASIVAAMSLAGCASMSQNMAETASQLPQVGLPANAPARPAQQMAYPAVHDVPPPRTATVLTDLEQQKLENDLLAARDQQQISLGTKPAARKKTQPGKPAAAAAAASAD
jgi:hypothetical protein